MYGFENMGQVLNADTTWFEDVARGLLTEFGGFAGIIPSQIKEGDNYHYDFSAALPSTVLKPEKASLVALLIDKDGVIVNAEKSRFPIMFTGLATCVMFSANQFNLGAEGGIMLGAFVSAMVAIYVPLPPVLLPVFAVLAGAVSVAVMMLIPAVLKAKLGVSEMVNSLCRSSH